MYECVNYVIIICIDILVKGTYIKTTKDYYYYRLIPQEGQTKRT